MVDFITIILIIVLLVGLFIAYQILIICQQNDKIHGSEKIELPTEKEEPEEDST